MSQADGLDGLSRNGGARVSSNGRDWWPVCAGCKGATPVLSPAEARKLLESIDTGALAGLRDRALLSVMLYSFARVSAVLGMRRQDYFGQGSRGWLRLHEKGGKRHDSPGPPPCGRGPRRLRRGGQVRGAEGGALPDRGPGGAAVDGPGARPAARASSTTARTKRRYAPSSAKSLSPRNSNACSMAVAVRKCACSATPFSCGFPGWIRDERNP